MTEINPEGFQYGEIVFKRVTPQKKNKKYLFLCGSYKPLLIALYYKHVRKKDVVIVTYSKAIQKFCAITGEDLFPFDTKIRGTLNPLTIYRYKKELDEVISQLLTKYDPTNSVVVFTGYSKGHEMFYITKQLSKHMAVAHKHVEKTTRQEKRRNIRGSILKAELEHILKLKPMAHYVSNSGDVCIGVKTPDFDEMVSTEELDPDIEPEEMIYKAMKKIRLYDKKFDVIIASQGDISNHIDMKMLYQLYNDVFDMKLNCAYKEHPYSEEHAPVKVDLPADCVDIPHFYPLELCLSQTRVVIAPFSTTLISASKLRGVKAVSLLNIVKWHRDSGKKKWKKYLKEGSNGKILFPKNIIQLKKILKK
jgi:hypothetical protein